MTETEIFAKFNTISECSESESSESKNNNKTVTSISILYFEIELNETDKQKSQEIIDNICKKLLINPVIENYKINLKE